MKKRLIILFSVILVLIVGFTVAYSYIDARLTANSVAIVEAGDGAFDEEFDFAPDEGLEIISEEEYYRVVEEEDAEITDEEFREAIEDEYLQASGETSSQASSQESSQASGESSDVTSKYATLLLAESAKGANLAADGTGDGGDEGDEGDGGDGSVGDEDEAGEDELIFERVEISDRVYTVLLMGDDARIHEPRGRSDTMILVSYNRDTHVVYIASFMRDMLIPNNAATGGNWNRINRLYADGGPGKAINTLNQLFSLDIQRYAVVRFSSVFALVDQLGGLDIDLKKNEAGVVSRIFPEFGVVTEGYNHLNGRQTLAYARMRQIDNDFNRTARQRNVLRTTIAKLFESKNIGDIVTLANFAFDQVETNVPLDELLTISYEVFTRGMPEIVEFRMPIDGSYQHATYYGASVLLIDFPKNIRAMHETLFGSSEGVKIAQFRRPSNMGTASTTRAAATTTTPTTTAATEEAVAAGAADAEGGGDDGGGDGGGAAPDGDREIEDGGYGDGGDGGGSAAAAEVSGEAAGEIGDEPRRVVRQPSTGGGGDGESQTAGANDDGEAPAANEGANSTEPTGGSGGGAGDEPASGGESGSVNSGGGDSGSGSSGGGSGSGESSSTESSVATTTTAATTTASANEGGDPRSARNSRRTDTTSSSSAGNGDESVPTSRVRERGY